MAALNLLVQCPDGDLLPVAGTADTPLGTLLAAVATLVKLPYVQLLVDGAPVSSSDPSRTLRSLGIARDSILFATEAPAPSSGAPAPSFSSGSSSPAPTPTPTPTPASPTPAPTPAPTPTVASPSPSPAPAESSSSSASSSATSSTSATPATASSDAAPPTASSSSAAGSSSSATAAPAPAAAAGGEVKAGTGAAAEGKTEAPRRGVGAALEEKTIAALRVLLFGADPVPLDVERWHSQGFNFCKNEKIPWGLTQLHGGPCGILAPIQGFLLRDLIFTPDGEQKTFDGEEMPIRPSPDQVIDALIRSLALVLERAAAGGGSIIVVTGPPSAMCQTRLADVRECATFLRSQLSELRATNGVLLFVYSVLLSRGIERVKADMDESSAPLVARFGHCTQELVNLIIIGQATTNIFDGQRELHGLTLKGIPVQGDIGYLSLMEVMQYSQVGEHYKTAKVPIWVVGSDSHYTVLFGLSTLIGAISEEEKMLQVARAAFDELDPTGQTFIDRATLPKLLRKLGIEQPADLVANVVDPDQMGICLWGNIEKALRDYAPMQKAPAKAAPAAPWTCGVCTFANPGSRRDCEMCTSPAPAPPPAKVAAPTSGGGGSESKGAGARSLTNFTLYHFNGIDGRGKDVAECSRVRVNVITGGPPTMARGRDAPRGLREVIQTRFPTATVEFLSGKDPKIN